MSCPPTNTAAGVPSSSPDYSCSICFESAKEPVVTKCGHLYCWECLKAWLVQKNQCPMCNGTVNQQVVGDIIPIYGSGNSSGGGSTASGKSTSATGEGAELPPRHHQFATDQQRRATSSANDGTGGMDGGGGGRPAGNREQPPPEPRQNHNRGAGGWGAAGPMFGGGGGFFFLSPGLLGGIGLGDGLIETLISLAVMAGVGWLVWKLVAIFQDWRNGNLGVGGANEGAAGPNHHDEQHGAAAAEGAAANNNNNDGNPIDWSQYASWMGIALVFIVFTLVTTLLVDESDLEDGDGGSWESTSAHSQHRHPTRQSSSTGRQQHHKKATATPSSKKATATPSSKKRDPSNYGERTAY